MTFKTNISFRLHSPLDKTIGLVMIIIWMQGERRIVLKFNSYFTLDLWHPFCFFFFQNNPEHLLNTVPNASNEKK